MLMFQHINTEYIIFMCFIEAWSDFHTSTHTLNLNVQLQVCTYFRSIIIKYKSFLPPTEKPFYGKRIQDAKSNEMHFTISFKLNSIIETNHSLAYGLMKIRKPVAFWFYLHSTHLYPFSSIAKVWNDMGDGNFIYCKHEYSQWPWDVEKENESVCVCPTEYFEHFKE